MSNRKRNRHFFKLLVLSAIGLSVILGFLFIELVLKKQKSALN